MHSSTVNVTCSVDATDGKPAFHINYKTTNISDVRVIAKYEPLVSDLGYYFSGSVQEQIIINDSTDIVCIVSDARGRYINSRHIAGNGKLFSWYTISSMIMALLQEYTVAYNNHIGQNAYAVYAWMYVKHTETASVAELHLNN